MGQFINLAIAPHWRSLSRGGARGPGQNSPLGHWASAYGWLRL